MNVVFNTEAGKPCACVIVVEPLVLLIFMLTGQAVNRLCNMKIMAGSPVASV